VTAPVEAPQAEHQSECQNCGQVWPDDAIDPQIPDLHERVAPGEPMPTGECPDCGCLCQPIT
jgi:hypothetical protein